MNPETSVSLMAASVRGCRKGGCTQKHYAPWVKVGQDKLEEAVQRTF